MELVQPSAEYKDSFIEAVKEFQTDEDYTHRNKWYRALSIADLAKEFHAFVEKQRDLMRSGNVESELPSARVPQTEYWLIEDKKYIGRISIRHQLNEQLSYIGGHVGFDIRPSERGKGYGNLIFELAFPKAKELGLQRVLLTCDERNVASRKIIEKFGGVFENSVPNHEKGFEGHDARRYWIDIK